LDRQNPATEVAAPFSLGALIGFRLVIVMVLLFVAGYLGAIEAFGPESSRSIFALISVAFGLNLVYAVLLGLASSRLQAWVQMVGDLAVVTGFVYLTGSDRTGFVILYPVVVLCGSVLVGRGFTLAWLATLMYGGLLYFVREGRIPPEGLSDFAFGPARTVINSIILMALSSLMVAVLGRGVTRSLQRAGTSLDEAAGRVASLQELNRLIVENITSGLLLTDAHDRVAFVNDIGKQILGVVGERARGRRPADLLGTDRVNPSTSPRQPAAGGETRFEVDLADQGGDVRTLGVSIVDLGQVATRGRLFVFRDLTEIRRLEEQARLNEKLAAVGGVAAQMAHEIRNPLGAISAASKLLSEGTLENPQDRDLLRIIVSETTRLGHTVNSFLRDLGSSVGENLSCDAAQCIADATRLLELSPERSPSHLIDFDYQGGPVEVKIAAQELSQVFWNLARNGLEAMPHGGRLSIRLSSTEETARLEIEDEGEGFDQERLRTLFEPLKTTKTMGTGLGLAIAHRIVRQRGGDFSIRSVRGKGALATIVLVRAPSQAA
jgi:two-component system sensor histidine kinase PilS (NtrC family)